MSSAADGIGSGRLFTQALGQSAEKHAVDAWVVGRVGAALGLRRVEAASRTRPGLDELGTTRDALVKDRTAAVNRQRQLRQTLLRRWNGSRLSQIDRQVTALDAEIARLFAADGALSRKAEVATSVPGIVQVTVAHLLSEMPELVGSTAKPQPVWPSWRRSRASRALGRSGAWSAAVGRDNCVRFEARVLQLPADRHRPHYVKARVKVRRHADGTLSVWHGPRKLARYSPDGEPLADELPAAA